MVYQFYAYVGRGFTPADLAIFSFLQNEFRCPFIFPSMKVFEGCGVLFEKSTLRISVVGGGLFPKSPPRIPALRKGGKTVDIFSIRGKMGKRL